MSNPGPAEPAPHKDDHPSAGDVDDVLDDEYDDDYDDVDDDLAAEDLAEALGGVGGGSPLAALLGGAGGGLFGGIFEQAQRMQSAVGDAQRELEAARVEGSAGGGLVKATVSGSGELVALEISPKAVDPEDTETLADLVIAAVRDASTNAHRLADQKMSAATGDLGNLLGGFGGGFGGPTGPGGGFPGLPPGGGFPFS